VSDSTHSDASGAPVPDDDLDPRLAAVEESAAQDAAAVGAAPVPAVGSHPVLRYTLARLAILAVVAAVLYILGARGLLLLVFAFLISGLIAMVALKNTREDAAYGITSAIRSANAKIDAGSAAEDASLDAAQAAAAQTDGASAAAPPSPARPAAATPAPAPEPAAPLDDWDDPAPR
jgi:hypothetical protein